MKRSHSGEFALIEKISRVIGKNSRNVVRGIGDDCAVISGGRGRYMLAASDAIVESVHFDLSYYSFFGVGWKALGVNLSDIAAMGGIPKYALVSLGLTKGTTPKDVSEIYRGMKKLAQRYCVDIVGGDTVLSPQKLFVSVTVTGEVEKKKVLYRKGAKPGDLIMVTGKFGRGLTPQPPLLKERGSEDTTFNNPSPLGEGWPKAGVRVRIPEGRTIALSGKATAMMDSSDGLAFTIGEICRQSGVGADIVKSLIPRAKGASVNDALYAGEDFELVFTCPPDFADIIADKVRAATGTRVSIIGRAVHRSKGVNIDTKGFEHF